ncbi:hypothetical protein [Staphylococcus lugdunensis]|nr:hypothetical protein LE189_01495 [Staphylococcus lugdunensis]UZW84363.1 hypothetical protein LE167_03600 [Staphylococcus lugdunensis]UZW86784.1 hypothetical protein LE164_06650 [Staphylococcus lugdunensis]UZW89216.1 hypothetical protein LE166_07490 [Staphylococcus lugdunensis]UZW91632.1 hypothetical protein LE165_10930 [Staphylococcus lugdunensis]
MRNNKISGQSSYYFWRFLLKSIINAEK